MRIEDFPPSPLKGQSVGRASDARAGGARGGGSQSPRLDEVSLSGLAVIAGGAPAGRIEQLKDDVSKGTYLVPANEISHRVVEYYLGG